MLHIDPFENMFKMSAYTKWYHYFWGMPLLCMIWLYFFIINGLDYVFYKITK